MPGCSSPPVISASSRNRWRLTGSSAWWSRICLSATSRCSSLSSATKTAPSPPRACGRRTRNRWPSVVGRADGVASRCGRDRPRRRSSRAAEADMGERRLDLGVAEPGQALAGRPAGGDGGQALLDVAAVLLEVQGDDRFEAGAGVGVEVAAGDEVVGQAPGLVAGPGLEGGDELALVDQAVLKREQSEEEMAVGGGGHGMAPIVGGRSGEGPSLGLLCMSFHLMLRLLSRSTILRTKPLDAPTNGVLSWKVRDVLTKVLRRRAIDDRSPRPHGTGDHAVAALPGQGRQRGGVAGLRRTLPAAHSPLVPPAASGRCRGGRFARAAQAGRRAGPRGVPAA